MKTSENIINITVALIKARGEFPPIKKVDANPYFRSKYAALDGIVETVTPILLKHELMVIQGNDPIETGVVVTTRILHSSGEWIESAIFMPIKPNKKGSIADPQAFGSAVTYGRRYAISGMLGIAPEKDDDGNAANQRGAGKISDGQPDPAGVKYLEASKNLNDLQEKWKTLTPDQRKNLTPVKESLKKRFGS